MAEKLSGRIHACWVADRCVGLEGLKVWYNAALALETERDQLQQQVMHLQSGQSTYCAYCGRRYGPADAVPATMADAIREHVESCPKHPMSALRKQRDTLLIACKAAYEALLRRGPGPYREVGGVDVELRNQNALLAQLTWAIALAEPKPDGPPVAVKEVPDG